MKCKICRGPASVQLPHYNMNLCENHFISFIEKRVQQTIEKFNMFKKDNKILVAFSGGKDSVSLWHILTKLGYQADAVFVKLGTAEQVAPVMQILEQMSKKLQRNYFVEDATAYLYGRTVFEAARIMRRPTCGFCGKVKRYLMNKAAVENGYDVLVTGHNIDDEASLLLGNLLHWQKDYIVRTWPVLEKTHEKFVKKAKPHALNYERDILKYVELLNLPYLKSTCPFSIGATMHIYKQVWEVLEKEQPNAKVTFYKGFLREKKDFFKVQTTSYKLQTCKVCGFPSGAEICSFCSARNVLKQKIDRKKQNSGN